MQSSCLNIKRIEDDLYLVKSGSTNKYIKMGQEELDFLKYLKEYEEEERFIDAESFVYKDFTKEELFYLIDCFSKWKLINSYWFKKESEENNPKEKKHLKVFGEIDISCIHIISFNPQALLDRIVPNLRFLFSRYTVVLYFISIITSLVILKSNKQILKSMSFEDIDFGFILIMIIAFIFTIVLHEFSHAISCHHFGGKVKVLGIMLFYLEPAFYCDISDIYFFDRKKHKILVSASGIICQLILSSFSIFIYFFLRLFNIDLKILLFYWILNTISCIVNLNPLIKLDGYWMLSSYLGITNLREKSFTYIYSLFIKKNQLKIKTNEKNIYLFYGVFGIIFSIAFWTICLYQIYLFMGYILNNALKNVIISVIVFLLLKKTVTFFYKSK